jgi:hypothetical protein
LIKFMPVPLVEEWIDSMITKDGELNISNQNDMTYTAFQKLCMVKSLENIKSLDLSGSIYMEDNSLIGILESTGGNLKKLYLKECYNITNECLYKLIKSCHQLELLDISDCFLVSQLKFP